MITMQVTRPRPLPRHLGCVGTLVFNGCGYVLTDPRRGCLRRLDAQLCPVDEVDMAACYAALCFDPCAGCYWAAEQDGSVLYRLDWHFRQTQRLRLEGVHGRGLCAMSCGCEEELWLAFSDAVWLVNLATGCCQRFLCYGMDRRITGVLGLCDGRLTSFTEGNRTFIEIQCSGCAERAEICIPREFCLDAMVCLGVHHRKEVDCMEHHIQLLLSKPGCRECACMDCCVSCCADDCCPPQPCEPCPPPHHGCSAHWEILHSIAMEEKSIAHILNAEGEKLQKAVDTCDRIEDLLCVNDSVKQTINQITLLEGQLYSKLEALAHDCPLCKPGT